MWPGSGYFPIPGSVSMFGGSLLNPFQYCLYPADAGCHTGVPPGHLSVVFGVCRLWSKDMCEAECESCLTVAVLVRLRRLGRSEIFLWSQASKLHKNETSTY